MSGAVLAVCLSVIVAAPGVAQTPPDAQRGQVLASTLCAHCHSIDRSGPSPLAIAPPLRDLYRRYPVDNLRGAFAEGIVTGHPAMPEFRFDPDQIDNLIAFLKWID